MAKESTTDAKSVDAKDDDKTIVKFTAPPETWAYLGWLSENTVLGKNENEVAQKLEAIEPILENADVSALELRSGAEFHGV